MLHFCLAHELVLTLTIFKVDHGIRFNSTWNDRQKQITWDFRRITPSAYQNTAEPRHNGVNRTRYFWPLKGRTVIKKLNNFYLIIIWFGKKSKRRSPFGLFESCREKRISLCFMRRLGKLVHFSGRMGLRMKLIAKKELILLFQMTPSRILCDW